MSNRICIVRLLLDEDGGSHSLLTALEEAGHDVKRVVDIDELGAGTTDKAVFAYAITDNRVLITKNGSDFIALGEPGRDHPGILIYTNPRGFEFGRTDDRPCARKYRAHL